MEDLTIGQMARLNCVSERTLRVYDEKGLLRPDHRNERTGYRLYSLSQCSVLDQIQELQHIGFSLDEIGEIFQSRDSHVLRKRLSEKYPLILQQAREISRAVKSCRSLAEECDIADNRPELGKMAIEELPTRHALRFNVKNERMLTSDFKSSLDVMSAWRASVCMIKQEIVERGYPLTCYRDVACVVPKAALAAGDIVFYQAFVFIGKRDAVEIADAETIPASQYLTLYCDDISDADGPFRETAYIHEMLDWIKQHGYRITGDYIGQPVLDSAVFVYDGADELVKMQIPIEKIPSADEGFEE